MVGISDSAGWDVEFSRVGVGFGNAEDDVDEGELELADRGEALAIAREFLEGDFEAHRQRSWA